MAELFLHLNYKSKNFCNVSSRRIIPFLHAFRVLMLCTSLLTSLLQLENCFSLLWNITWLVMMKNVHFVHFSCNISYPHSTPLLAFYFSFYNFHMEHSSYWVFFPSCHRITFTICVAFVLTANRLDLDVKPKSLDFWPNRDIKWICRFTSFANFRPLFVHIIQFIADIISFFHWFSFVGKKLQNCVQRRQTVCVCMCVSRAFCANPSVVKCLRQCWWWWWCCLLGLTFTSSSHDWQCDFMFIQNSDFLVHYVTTWRHHMHILCHCLTLLLNIASKIVWQHNCFPFYSLFYSLYIYPKNWTNSSSIFSFRNVATVCAKRKVYRQCDSTFRPMHFRCSKKTITICRIFVLFLFLLLA